MVSKSFESAIVSKVTGIKNIGPERVKLIEEIVGIEGGGVEEDIETIKQLVNIIAKWVEIPDELVKLKVKGKNARMNKLAQLQAEIIEEAKQDQRLSEINSEQFKNLMHSLIRFFNISTKDRIEMGIEDWKILAMRKLQEKGNIRIEVEP